MLVLPLRAVLARSLAGEVLVRAGEADKAHEMSRCVLVFALVARDAAFAVARILLEAPSSARFAGTVRCARGCKHLLETCGANGYTLAYPVVRGTSAGGLEFRACADSMVFALAVMVRASGLGLPLRRSAGNVCRALTVVRCASRLGLPLFGRALVMILALAIVVRAGSL